MKTINSIEQFKKEIIDINNGKSIFLPLDVDIANRLNLIQLKINSYNNLFLSYCNNTSEEVNKFNLDKFLEKYYEQNLIKEELMKNELVKLLGIDLFKLIIENNVNYYFNYELNYIELKK